MSQHDIHSKAYAEQYVESHKKPDGRKYRQDYWNHFFIDSIINDPENRPTHLLEEGGGTCGVWKALSFDRYTSVDISEEMTVAGKNLHDDTPGVNFILGDVFSNSLHPGAYSAIIANAYGVYYRPDIGHLERFYTLLAPQGMLFVAIDPISNIKHVLAAPAAALINRYVRPYRRIASRSFEGMARRAGFRIWLETHYTPAPGWYRKAFFLIKD